METQNRKNSCNGWLTSAIAGDPSRGIGILNNPIYKGQVIWGRSKWTRGASDSTIRTVTRVDPSQWIVTEHPELRIVSDELWNAVQAIQTATTPRREAVRAGIAKRASGHARPYWLVSLIVCADCGANYCGHGALDYACPSFTAGKCTNNVRFRREEIHRAMFGLLKVHLLSDAAMARGTTYVEALLEKRARLEDESLHENDQCIEVRRLNEDEAALRRMNLRPAAINAALAAIERERTELAAHSKGSRDAQESHARRLLKRLPEIVAEYKWLVQMPLRYLLARKP
jgi:hypothetical protein